MIREVISRFIKRTSDVFFEGRNKATIIIGTDRKNTVDSGYGDGGENDVDSAAIDIVVGYGASQRDPDYEKDKSRIYIAEKTDPDDYFGISVGDNVEEEAAIIQHSDNVYLKARNKIKILNGNISILISDNGEIEISAENKATITVGSSKIIANSDGSIDLDAGQGISGNIITDQDVCVGTDPVTGAQIISNFQTAPASPTRNTKVKVK